MLIKELHPLSRSFFVVAGENTIQYTHHVPEKGEEPSPFHSCDFFLPSSPIVSELFCTVRAGPGIESRLEAVIRNRERFLFAVRAIN
jgi:hypothetical protein